jgi:hypothetical protein
METVPFEYSKYRDKTRAIDWPIKKFLDKYATAFLAGDTETLVSMWELPAFVLNDDDVVAVESEEEIKEFFTGATEEYVNVGITNTRAEIEHVRWATDNLVVVTVRWPYLDDLGKEHGSESSTYILRRDDEGNIKFQVALMQGATEVS